MHYQSNKFNKSLRGAAIQACVFQCKNVDCAFVTGAAEEVTVTAEVYAVEGLNVIIFILITSLDYIFF